ncbi:Retrovirus-related Pol polyprotein from transposon TNT 1-94 [Glycine max]|nr:Retrovirus-related Pol polyprotein from transposon TNT 1-94 [Glycine max]
MSLLESLDQALEDERPSFINETEWTKIQKRVVSTIWLALAPEIEHNVLKKITPKALWEKLENIYASKSLTNRLCLEMELYQLKMEKGGELHDHINKFN